MAAFDPVAFHFLVQTFFPRSGVSLLVLLAFELAAFRLSWLPMLFTFLLGFFAKLSKRDVLLLILLAVFAITVLLKAILMVPVCVNLSHHLLFALVVFAVLVFALVVSLVLVELCHFNYWLYSPANFTT